MEIYFVNRYLEVLDEQFTRLRSIEIVVIVDYEFARKLNTSDALANSSNDSQIE